MNEYLWFFVINWLAHVALTSIVCLPLIILSRKVVAWQWYEIVALVVPFWFWASLIYFTDLKAKTMANILEGQILSILILLYVVLRIFTSKVLRNNYQIVMLIILCLSGALIYFVFPALPEPN